MSAVQPPTGEQFELVAGDQRAVVVELGAGLRSYSVAGVDVLEGYGVAAAPDGSRGEVLLPFPNRIDGGRYELDGIEHQLPLTEPERVHAIHGLTRFMNWRGSADGPAHVVMELVLRPSLGYPFTLSLALEYSLSSLGLTVRTTAHNVGERRAPFAAGYHPYLEVGTGLVNAALLTIPARTYLETDDRLIPTRRSPVEMTAFDFREPRLVGDSELDTCFTDIERDPDGFARARLSAPGRVTAIAVDAAYDYLQVASGDMLPAGAARRGMAIEPMTAPPNAFRSGEGLIVLEAGKSFEGSWRIEPSTSV